MMKRILILLFCAACMFQEVQAQQKQDENSTSAYKAYNINATLSVTELDPIRHQLMACWNVPAGPQDAKDFYVDVRVEMNPDATVK